MTLLFLHLHGHRRKLADREANEENIQHYNTIMFRLAGKQIGL
jgi:hypothetical protein